MYNETTLCDHYPPLSVQQVKIITSQFMVVPSPSKCLWRGVEILSLGDISSRHITLTFPFESWDGWSALSPPPLHRGYCMQGQDSQGGPCLLAIPFVLFSSRQRPSHPCPWSGRGEKKGLRGKLFILFQHFISVFSLVCCSLQHCSAATFYFELNFSFFSQPTTILVEKTRKTFTFFNAEI